MQKYLNNNQISAFYHDKFVTQQLDHFKRLAYLKLPDGSTVVDVGGGCGHFAIAIAKCLKVPVRLIDMDPESVKFAKTFGINAIEGDALCPEKNDTDGIICFNLILHHLVGDTEKKTRSLQSKALLSWKNTRAKLFINEYIYESWFNDISGKLIYQITKNKLVSNICKLISKIAPSLRANTFGVGVRFRSSDEWCQIFNEIGYNVVDRIRGNEEPISWPRRILLIKEIRRDSFLLSES